MVRIKKMHPRNITISLAPEIAFIQEDSQLSGYELSLCLDPLSLTACFINSQNFSLSLGSGASIANSLDNISSEMESPHSWSERKKSYLTFEARFDLSRSVTDVPHCFSYNFEENRGCRPTIEETLKNGV